MTRQTVLLVYGGESTEHDVSVRSARSVYAAMDGEKYDTLLCYIDVRGKWWLLDHWKDDLDEHGGAQLVAALGSHSFLVLPGNAIIRPDVIVPLLIESVANEAVAGLAQLLHVATVCASPETGTLARHLLGVHRKLEKRDITVEYGSSQQIDKLVVALAGGAKQPTTSGAAYVIDSDAPDDTLRSVADESLQERAIHVASEVYGIIRCSSYAVVTLNYHDDELSVASVDTYPELSTSGTFLKLWRMNGTHYPDVVDTLISTARK